MKSYLTKYLLSALLFISLSSCSPDNDDTQSALPATESEINEFIWKGLNKYYLWQENVPTLNDSFVTTTSYSQLLQTSNPFDVFESLRYSEDNYSYMISNYSEQQNFPDSDNTSGMHYRLLQACLNCNELIGAITYVDNNSSAQINGLKRGDLIFKVNGQTLNQDNYTDLRDDNFSITTGTFSSSGSIEEIKTVDLTTGLVEQTAVKHYEILEENGTKIGYLTYNSFIYNQEEQLNNVFGAFKSSGISELVLDLRYNLGGRISTSAVLASMITGQFEGQVYAKEVWNSKIQPILEQESPDSIVNLFPNSTGLGNTINSLNLSRVYILTSSYTASASELVINGLSPYINVETIGTTTFGKNVGSITVRPEMIDGLNSNHDYAMQPIVLKVANKDNFGDYSDGLSPDYLVRENLTNLRPFGDKTDPLLSKALELITGDTSRSAVVAHDNYYSSQTEILTEKAKAMLFDD